MVDDLGNRIDVAQEHVANVNTRMKVRFTLEGAATVSVYFAPAVYFNQLTCCTRCQDFFFFHSFVFSCFYFGLHKHFTPDSSCIFV